MQTNLWNELGFKKNPFNIVPDKESGELIWAGFNSKKEEFDRIIRACLGSTEAKVILNLSRYGSGKTHAAYYFAKHSSSYMPSDGILPLHIIITAPKTGENAVWDFYVKLIEAMSFTTIRAALQHHRQTVGDGAALSELQAYAKSEDLGRLVWLLADSDPDVEHAAGEVLMSGKASAPTRKKLRIRRGLDSNSDTSQILSALINTLARYDANGPLAKSRRVFVWLDEMEALVFYSSRHYRPFTQALRELVDCTPQHLALVLNFSFASPREAENLEIVIGEALLDRVTDKIVFEEGSSEESFQYLHDILAHYRISGQSPSMFPFTQEAARRLIELAPERTGKPRTARRINQWCQQAVQAAKAANAIPTSGITVDFIEKLGFVQED